MAGNNYYQDFYGGVDPNRVYQIESGGNPKAYNKGSGARGLGQITPIALKDYNQMNPKDPYTMDDLWDPQINQKIAYWTLSQRIPSMLQAYNLEVTPENVLWAYNAGIGNVRKNRKPPQTVDYLKKYFGGNGGIRTSPGNQQ